MCKHLWTLEEEIHWEESYIEVQKEEIEKKQIDIAKHMKHLNKLYSQRTWLSRILGFLKLAW